MANDGATGATVQDFETTGANHSNLEVLAPDVFWGKRWCW